MIWSGQTSHCSWLSTLKGVRWKQNNQKWSNRNDVSPQMFRLFHWQCRELETQSFTSDSNIFFKLKS